MRCKKTVLKRWELENKSSIYQKLYWFCREIREKKYKKDIINKTILTKEIGMYFGVDNRTIEGKLKALEMFEFIKRINGKYRILVKPFEDEKV